MYTDEKLSQINGTPELDKCIKKLLAPVNFAGRISDLDNHIKEFNQFLAFDKWKIIRNGAEVTFKKLEKIEFDESESTSSSVISEEEFLKRDFQEIPLESVGLDGGITEIIKLRVDEIEKCLTAEAPLSIIFLAGSTLEGVLLGIALKYPKEFNFSRSSPKYKDGKVKQFQDWTLNNFIDVAHEVGLLAEDVKKYSHTLRDFRNYIHPYEQMSSGFNPDKHTAKISWQVLKAALFQLSRNKVKTNIL